MSLEGKREEEWQNTHASNTIYTKESCLMRDDRRIETLLLNCNRKKSQDFPRPEYI